MLSASAPSQAQDINIPGLFRGILEEAIEADRDRRSSQRGRPTRSNRGGAGEADEVPFLAPLFAIAESGATQAERLLERYRTEWAGSVEPVFTEYVF